MVASAYQRLRSWLWAADSPRAHNPEDARSSRARPINIGLEVPSPPVSARRRRSVRGRRRGSTATSSEAVAKAVGLESGAGVWRAPQLAPVLTDGPVLQWGPGCAIQVYGDGPVIHLAGVDVDEPQAEDDATEVAWCDRCSRAMRPYDTCPGCGEIDRFG